IPSQSTVIRLVVTRQDPSHAVSKPSAHHEPRNENTEPSSNSKVQTAAARPASHESAGVNSWHATDTGRVPTRYLAWSNVCGASGFSVKTWHPEARPARTTSKCAAGGVVLKTISTSSAPRDSSISVDVGHESS